MTFASGRENNDCCLTATTAPPIAPVSDDDLRVPEAAVTEAAAIRRPKGYVNSDGCGLPVCGGQC